jgi:hypothetical protein
MPKTRKNRKNRKYIYSEKEYNSGDGMLTSVWGPAMWHYLHAMSFNYPVEPSENDKRNYRDFVMKLKYVLPCKYCRINLKKNLKSKPLTICHMKNRETFSRYIYELHELVNQMLNKESNLTYEDVRERYEHFRSRCTDDKAKRVLSKQSPKTTRRKRKKESGCTEPLYGKKSKCIINIVPQEIKTPTFQMDEKCIKTKQM